MNVDQIIKIAKLGSERKAAQIDTCTVFAAALFDFLKSQNQPCAMKTATFYLVPGSRPEWHHAVVEHNGRLYDSMGAFSHEAVRARAKIHSKCSSRLDIRDDVRADCYEEEFEELYLFFSKKLRNADKICSKLNVELIVKQ